MLKTGRELYKAIHEGKWLSVVYKNRDQETTRYWIAVKDLDPINGKISVDGFHVTKHTVMDMTMYFHRIQSAAVLDGTICDINDNLVEDIRLFPEKYASFFASKVNLGVLEYLAQCNKLDTTPYYSDYSLVKELDDAKITSDGYILNDRQFEKIVNDFQRKSSINKSSIRMQEIGMNMLGVQTIKGLYLLAYKPLKLDVQTHTLKFASNTIICREFTVNGYKESIRSFLDEEDCLLLEDPDFHMESIRNRITQNGFIVDDMPYIIAVGRDHFIDLEHEYEGILDMYEDNNVTVPIRAFFGELTDHEVRRKFYSFSLIDKEINMDQLLAMNHALRSPIAYVQGPPGTGKTKTIVNTIVTAYVYQRTVLFASNNNHPIDGVVSQLKNLYYKTRRIPFPVARLGNNDEIEKTLEELKETYARVKTYTFERKKTPPKKSRAQKARNLSQYLQRYDRMLELKERKEAMETLLENNQQMNFQLSLQTGQLASIEKQLAEMEEFRIEDALQYVDDDTETLMQFLYDSSIRHLQKLSEEKYDHLRNILRLKPEERTREFVRYISSKENLMHFLDIFPVVATTSASSYKLAGPQPVFDMVIIDEASQCNTAVSLCPIIRGKNLLLVGDPQQLSPVVLLEETDNLILRRRYHVTEEYDYIENSVYKTFLACDSVSDEVLLSYHYRCDPKIINFNNRKYYNDKLKILSENNKDSLQFINIQNNESFERNSSFTEAMQIKEYIEEHPEEKIGVITPFANQNKLITELTRAYDNVTCGTVHAFQGDEKDVILFSLSLTDHTADKTYEWLKNNRELINVATSRAKKKLVVIGSEKQLERLHGSGEEDDLYELVQYVKNNGNVQVTGKPASSRALGIRPYSTQTEQAFLASLNHALDNAFQDGSNYKIYKEVPVSQVFQNHSVSSDFFYKGRFDFVVYQKTGKKEYPILAIELDGMEHLDQEIVKERDRKKEEICHQHGFSLIRVENTYARRYHYIKDILIDYFHGR
ncbi:MAG: DUF2726 domain-containing protein [Solobacterium sp.]|nr:DUF2726 domain-containing protein [Solobacterium sp.]